MPRNRAKNPVRFTKLLLDFPHLVLNRGKSALEILGRDSGAIARDCARKRILRLLDRVVCAPQFFLQIINRNPARRKRIKPLPNAVGKPPEPFHRRSAFFDQSEKKAVNPLGAPLAPPARQALPPLASLFQKLLTDVPKPLPHIRERAAAHRCLKMLENALRPIKTEKSAKRTFHRTPPFLQTLAKQLSVLLLLGFPASESAMRKKQKCHQK